MPMSKKDCTALANAIRHFNASSDETGMDGFLPFSVPQIYAIADFCQSQNSQFMRTRWVEYATAEGAEELRAVKE